MNNQRVTAIDDRVYGVWLWEGPNGAYLADEDGNYLSMQGTKYDLTAQRKMRDAATALGFGDGKPVWKSGMRKLTDAEYDLMMERLLDGKEPDPGEEYMQAVERANKQNGR